MVSFLKGIDETERKFFYSFLDNLEMKDKKIFIESFNEKIISSSPKTFPNGMSLGFDYFIGFSDSKIQVDESGWCEFHYGEFMRKEKKSKTTTRKSIKIRGGEEGSHISNSFIEFIYTPNKPIDKKEIKSFFGNKIIDIYKSKTEIIGLFKTSQGKSFVEYVLEFKKEKTLNGFFKKEVEFFIQLETELNNLLKEWFQKYKSLKNQVSGVLIDLDKDNNGQLDFIEGGDDFNSLLKKYQSKIIEIDRTYIQQFIKVSNYLTQKKQNLQVIFERLKDSVNQSQLDELGEILKQEIHTYNIILLNSLHMINSLVEDDMITFYDIYEKFDKLNMFTSNWENQVTEKLDEVNLNLVELMKELRDVGDRIVGSIDNLSYITEESTRQLTSKMNEIDSTLKVGNLINVIQTYQMYKVNKNTKSLRG